MIFAPESIEASKAGRKTKTRRPVRRGDTIECHPARAATIKHDLGLLQVVAGGEKMYEAAVTVVTPGMHIDPSRCSEPDPADVQYARVRFLKAAACGTCINVELDGDEGISTCTGGKYRWKWRLGRTYAMNPPPPKGVKARMGKQAGRLLLKGIRCERVGDISDEDAMAEGVQETAHGEWYFVIKGREFIGDTAAGVFLVAWKYLYPKSDLVELVWVLEYEVCP